MSDTIYNRKIVISTPLVHDENGYYHLVYCVTNIVNNKIYVGKHSTKNPYDTYIGSGKGIVQALKKYGKENFTKEILFCFTNENEAFLKEKEIVTQEFVERNDTYNMVVGGNMIAGSWSGENHPMYGKHLTEDHKNKLSNSRKGKMVGENNPMYGKTGENNPNYGKPRPQEVRNKISKAKKGKHPSQETRDKMSQNHWDNSGENNPMYGKHLSQEARDKLSKAKKGKYCGKNHPMYGKKHKQETITKMSDKAKERIGAKGSNAKAVRKIDESNNIVIEYGCMKECCEQEHIIESKLRKLIREHILYNGFYFEFKPKKKSN